MGHRWPAGRGRAAPCPLRSQGGLRAEDPGLTSQDEVQELEGRPEARVGDAALMGVQGQEGQAAEQGQEAGPHGEAAGHVVAVEHTVELRRVRLVLVAVGQQGGEDDEGEDLWIQEGVPVPESSSASPGTLSSPMVPRL